MKKISSVLALILLLCFGLFAQEFKESAEDVEFSEPAEGDESVVDEEDAETVVDEEGTEDVVDEEDTETVVNEEDAETVVDEEDAETVVDEEDTETVVDEEDTETVVNEEDAEFTETGEDTEFSVPTDPIAPPEGTEITEARDDAFGTTDHTYPAGSIVGIGASSFSYQTHWSFIQIGPVFREPIHEHKKQELQLFLENRSMFKFGPIHFDVRGEVRLGFLGKTSQKYMLEDQIRSEDLGDSIVVAFSRDTNGISQDIVSESGSNWAGGAQFKFAYPFELTPRAHIAFFVGSGLTFVLLEQAGGDVLNSQYQEEANLRPLSYNSGWNEFSLYAPIVTGLSLDFDGWSIILDYRRSIWGTTYTSWAPPTPQVPDPNPLNAGGTIPGPAISSPKQTFQGFGLSFAFRIGR